MDELEREGLRASYVVMRVFFPVGGPCVILAILAAIAECLEGTALEPAYDEFLHVLFLGVVVAVPRGGVPVVVGIVFH